MHMKHYSKTIAAALCAGGLGLAMGAYAQPAPDGMQGGHEHMRMHGHHGGGGEMRGLRKRSATRSSRSTTTRRPRSATR
jgi:hypothetical protein